MQNFQPGAQRTQAVQVSLLPSPSQLKHGVAHMAAVEAAKTMRAPVNGGAMGVSLVFVRHGSIHTAGDVQNKACATRISWHVLQTSWRERRLPVTNELLLQRCPVM